MKRLSISLLVAGVALALPAICLAAQSVNVVKGNVIYSFVAADAGAMRYTDGNTLTINDISFDLSEVDAIKVLPIEIDANTVNVDYSAEGAIVYVAGSLAPYVNAEVKGAHVAIIQSDDVSDATCGEITYVLKGESADGSFTQTGSYKSTIELQGLALTNPAGAAIDIENGKRIAVSAKNGTVNTITDGAGGKQKAALYCKGHLELKGKGTLNVTGLTGHAISAKEYIELKNCTLNVLGAVKDGLNCNQYFLMESGSVNIASTGDDGIQVSFKDSSDREAEDTGTFTMTGGTLTIADITATSAKGIKTEGDVMISGGLLTALSSAGGEWDSAKAKTKASSCIGADGNVNISGGTLNLTASGNGGKGISCDGAFAITAGEVNISTSGNQIVYANGKLYDGNYTGNTDRIESDCKSSPKGIKSDTEVQINGGALYVVTTGTGAEGIESKGTLTISDGSVKVRAYDDGVNSASHMYISGGTVDVISSKNDGLDSNGSIYISGGTVMAFGGASPECGIDSNDEEGYTVFLTGGCLLAAGGSNSYPRQSGSTQPYVTTSMTLAPNANVSIGTATDTFHTFTIPADYTASSGGIGGWRPGGTSGGSSVMISVPEMTNGTTYTISNGTTTITATSRLTGSSSGGFPRW